MSSERLLLSAASAGLLLLAACDDRDLPDEFEGDRLVECHDGVDNDRDGLFDCEDGGCQGMPGCSGGDGDGDGDADWPEPCDRVGHPDFTGVGNGVLGPEGGFVEQTDTSSGLAGVRVEVAPGDWEECWQVRVDAVSSYDTPSFPVGFEPFGEGSLRVEIGFPDEDWDFQPISSPLPIALSLPISRLEPGSNDVLCAFRYDEELGKWRAVFPDSMDADRMVIETTARSDQWSFGVIDLDEVDIDGDLRPALEEHLGADSLAAIEAELQAEFDSLTAEIERIAVENDWDLTCPLLSALADLFYNLKGETFIAVDDMQRSYGCGDCNPLTPRFQEELARYNAAATGVELGAALVTGTIGAFFGPGGAVLSEFISVAIAGGINSQMAKWMGLACDYFCYGNHEDFDIQVGTYIYYIADLFLSVVTNIAADYIDDPCPFTLAPQVEGDVEWECGDGIDNDEDGWIDCDDEGCDGNPRFGCFIEELNEECDDGVDNDRDGATDCDDPSCDGALSPLLAILCWYEGNHPGECSDGEDNDWDEQIDCDDTGCVGSPECP